MNKKEKEIIEVRKLYLEQIEKFDSKIYFIMLLASGSIISLNFKYDNILGVQNLLLYLGIIVFLVTIFFSENYLDYRRKKKTNELIEDIKSGRIELIK